jgi:hypothetical protein
MMNYGGPGGHGIKAEMRIKADGRDRTWMVDAACKDKGPDWFFPASPDVTAPIICDTCPVRQECGEYGLHEAAGIWGGRNERERQRIARRRKRGAA